MLLKIVCNSIIHCNNILASIRFLFTAVKTFATISCTVVTPTANVFRTSRKLSWVAIYQRKMTSCFPVQLVQNHLVEDFCETRNISFHMKLKISLLAQKCLNYNCLLVRSGTITSEKPINLGLRHHFLKKKVNTCFDIDCFTKRVHIYRK